jgi:hypothetical protein
MKTLVSALLALCAVFQPGCSANKAATCDTPSDSLPSSHGCDVITCTGTTPTSFPSFDKACTIAGDCVIGIHQTSCCGSTLAIGLAGTEQTRFAFDENTCVAQYPQCACPATPTVTEDGQHGAPDKPIVVECQSGRCMTTVK